MPREAADSGISAAPEPGCCACSTDLQRHLSIRLMLPERDQILTGDLKSRPNDTYDIAQARKRENQIHVRPFKPHAAQPH
jgi:hypothetical protein